MVEYPGDQEIVTLFQKRLKAARDARRDFDTRCDLIDKHVEPFAHTWSKAEGGTDDLRTPHVFHILETLNANMIEPDPDFDLRPREYADDDSVKATKAGLSYQLERTNWSKKNARLVRRGNRYGAAVVKILWDYDELVEEEEVQQPHRNPLYRMFGRTETVLQENITILKDDPVVELVHREDFWWQPSAADIEDAEWCIHRIYVPREVLLRKQEEGVYRCVDKIGGAGGASMEDGPTPLTEDSSVADDRRKKDDEGVEVFEMWDKVRQRLVTIVGSTVIKDEPHPYDHGELPFAVYVPLPAEGRFEGISPVQPLIPIQLQTWQTENDRMRAVAMALNPTLMVDKTLKGGSEFHVGPGARIFVSDPSQIAQLNINANQHLGFAEVEAFLGYMQQVSGVSPFISGADAGSYGINQNTATGVNQLAGAAGRRIGFHIMQLQDTVARIGRQIIQLMHQYLDEERMVRIAGLQGEEWIKLSPEDIPAMFDISVKGSTESLNKQAERGQAVELMQALMSVHGMPTHDGKQIDATPSIAHLVETYGHDPDRYIIGQTEENAMMQQAELGQKTGEAQQAQAEAQMADPEMQMMMQQMQQQPPQPSINDFNGDGVDDIQRKAFESMNFKDMPVDAQAALLEARGLPSEGLLQQQELEQAEKLAKIQQMSSQARDRNGGLDNA